MFSLVLKINAFFLFPLTYKNIPTIKSVYAIDPIVKIIATTLARVLIRNKDSRMKSGSSFEVLLP
jgi:hypothetical protein